MLLDLSKVLSTMDIPKHRIVLNKRNLEWLEKNLGVRNSGHVIYPQIMECIRYRLKHKQYNS